MFFFFTVTHCSLQQRVKLVRAEEYAQGRQRMEAWRGHCPFALSKGVQRGGGALS